MNLQRWRTYLKRDGWLLAALMLAVVLCLGLSATDRASPSQNNDEIRLSHVLASITGAGQVEVMIYYDDHTLPCGAVIVADGAGDPAVRIRLASAVTTLLGLDASRIAVYEREGGTSP